MQNIPLAMALAGMELGKDVTRPDRPDGPVLFGRGAILTDTAIDRLRQIGVEYLTVKGRPLALESDEPLEDQLCKLDQRFQAVAHDPAMTKIRDLIRKQIIRTMSP